MSNKKTGTLTFKWDYNYAIGAFVMVATAFTFIIGVELLDDLGIQRFIFEFIGKWGALIEDGYNAQREIEQ